MKTYLIVMWPVLFLTSSVASAADVDSKKLAQWLCDVLRDPRVGERLASFPGARSGRVNYSEEKETDEGERYIAREWTFNAGNFDLSYRYQENLSDPSTFGFHLRIVGSTSS